MNRYKALGAILSYSNVAFIERVHTLKISEERADQFRRVLEGSIPVGGVNKFDIEEFALKHFYPPEIYKKIQTLWHIKSKGDNYNYDPAKNGQNIIKYGIAFGDVVSYSSQFGSVIVPIPHNEDAERVLLFSDLMLDKGRKIDLPPPKIKVKNFTLSVAVNIDGKFRFISARLLSSQKKKFTATVHQSIGAIDFPSVDSRDKFSKSCIEVFERHFQHVL